MREAGPLLKLQTKVAGHFVGDRVRSSHADSVDDIAPGTGAVPRPWSSIDRLARRSGALRTVRRCADCSSWVARPIPGGGLPLVGPGEATVSQLAASYVEQRT